MNLKQRLHSFRFQMLLGAAVMGLFVVILLTLLFTRAYNRMVLVEEQQVNEVGFETISQSITPLINTSVNEVRSIMSNDLVAGYARLQYSSMEDLIRARISCRNYLRTEIKRQEGIYGLLFMRKDGSLFGVLPDDNFFLDDPEENTWPEEIKTQILSTPLGQTTWIGPISGVDFYGFETKKSPQSIMIAVWKTVDVSYGECYVLMLMDDSVFENLFATLNDGKSSWHLFTEDGAEIYHTGEETCLSPDRLISESNSGMIFYDDNGNPICTFSMTMESPKWTLVRQVSMDDYERVVRGVRSSIVVLGILVFLIALAIYELWMKKITRQFRTLLNGIVRMGEGELKPIESDSFSVTEFETMRQEIDRTSLALNQQMDTIRRMERESVEQENRLKEQERIVQELRMAKELQRSALPMIFPPFPERTEFDLYASMTPAKEVGGDFYDFFMIDNDHLGLVIADVSGKGIPAALFMMVCKTLIKNELLNGFDPATAMERVNLKLCEHNSAKMFVTVWAAVLEISTGKSIACNAGHEHPAYRRSGEDFELLKYKHGMFAGISKKAKYQNREFELHPGDCFFVYTDGVPEANNVAGEMFGETRLVEALNSCADSSPEDILHKVRESVDAFAGDAEQFDDLTMLSLRYLGPESVKENKEQ